MSWGCKTENKPDGCGWANWQIECRGIRDWWCDFCERSGDHMVHKETHSLPDTPCESCGRRGRAMVTATIGGEQFRLCSLCGDDARENGCEVAS